MGLLATVSLLDLAALSAFGAALYALGLVAYRLWLSPIAQFPGPFLARTTFWYEFYHDWVQCGQYWMEIERMHQKYGPVVRITPTELHVRDSAFYHDLFVTGAVRKTDAYPRFSQGTGFEDMTAVSTTHEMHRATRAPLDPFFSVASITRMEDRAVLRVRTLRHRLNAFVNTGKPINMTHAFGSLMTDVVSCMLFEEPSDYLNDSDFNAEWFELMKRGSMTIPLLAHLPWFAKLLVMPIVRKLSERVTKWRMWDDKARRQIVNSKLRPADEARDRSDTTIFDHLVHSDLVESIFGNGGFARLSQLIQQAGTHNFSMTLGTIVTHVGLNAEVQATLRRELAALYCASSGKAPMWRDLERLPYLKAVYQEGLRMAMGLLHRQVRVAPEDDLSCSGWIIPRGTAVSMTNHWMHLDPTVFPDPHAFKPERWLGDPEMMRVMHEYCVPFSKGSRGCMAKNLVDMTILHTLYELYGPSSAPISLYHTDAKSIRPIHGFLFPYPKMESPGVRVVLGDRWQGVESEKV